jgi:protein-S-isoprenylcysteine O-methyltransferase Ste14
VTGATRRDVQATKKVPGTKGRVKRSEAIRKQFKRLGKNAKPNDVVAALAVKGLKVAPEQVNAVRAKLIARSNANRAPVARRIVNFLVRRRVPISLVVFAILMFEDIVMGFKPHDVANPADRHSILGLSLVFSGVGVRTWAAGTLCKTIRLTTVGIYQMVRNPLYVGSFMMMIGFVVLIDDPENIWFVLGPILLLYVFKVFNEEHALSARYRQAWKQYARSTPRFIPRTIPRNLLTGWSITQWMKNSEYKAVAGALAGLLGLRLWYLS